MGLSWKGFERIATARNIKRSIIEGQYKRSNEVVVGGMLIWFGVQSSELAFRV
jgi:hypothetical protein